MWITYISKPTDLVKIAFLSLAETTRLKNLLFWVTISILVFAVSLFGSNWVKQPHEIAAVRFLFKQAKHKRQNEDKFLNGLR